MHYYIVSEQNTSRFDFLVKSLIEGYPRALNSFGFLIASGEFNHMSHNYAVAYQFYKKAVGFEPVREMLANRPEQH